MANPTPIQHLAQIDSTNTKCVELAKTGTPGPVWVLADVQTQGRGRRGREWKSGTGNLYASGLYWFEHPPARLAELSFAAALAIADTLANTIASDALQLKWPNDVLLEGVKLAGILPESGIKDGRGWLVMGIGINLAHAPVLPDRGTACVGDYLGPGRKLPTPAMVLPQLIQSFEDWVARWEQDGFDPLRRAWVARAFGLGQKITTSDGHSGTFEDMSKNGALLLRKASGQVIEISAGEVFFP